MRIEGLAITLNGKPLFTAPDPRPGLLPGRHLHRADGRGSPARHRAEPGDGLQRRAPAPEGLRAALPLLGRQARLPRLGRVPELGARPCPRRGAGPLPPRVAGGEVLERDYSHPSIVGWCPFNETNNRQNPEVLRAVYRATKAVDPTRPVIDTSGYVHVETDIYDVHDYDQNPDTFAARYQPLAEGGEARRNFPRDDAPYRPRPAVLRERVRRHLVEPRPAGRGRLGLRRPPAERGGVPRALPPAHRVPAAAPEDVRLLLHAANRRRAGGQRCSTRTTASRSSTRASSARSTLSPRRSSGRRGRSARGLASGQWRLPGQGYHRPRQTQLTRNRSRIVLA